VHKAADGHQRRALGIHAERDMTRRDTAIGGDIGGCSGGQLRKLLRGLAEFHNSFEGYQLAGLCPLAARYRMSSPQLRAAISEPNPNPMNHRPALDVALTGPVPPHASLGSNGDMYLGTDGSVWAKDSTGFLQVGETSANLRRRRWWRLSTRCTKSQNV
jgi:hypothetical protein